MVTPLTLSLIIRMYLIVRECDKSCNLLFFLRYLVCNHFFGDDSVVFLYKNNASLGKNHFICRYTVSSMTGNCFFTHGRQQKLDALFKNL